MTAPLCGAVISFRHSPRFRYRHVARSFIAIRQMAADRTICRPVLFSVMWHRGASSLDGDRREHQVRAVLALVLVPGKGAVSVKGDRPGAVSVDVLLICDLAVLAIGKVSPVGAVVSISELSRHSAPQMSRRSNE